MIGVLNVILIGMAFVFGILSIIGAGMVCAYFIKTVIKFWHEFNKEERLMCICMSLMSFFPFVASISLLIRLMG
jgi:hypothetical protein